jgi:hypothetical protein
MMSGKEGYAVISSAVDTPKIMPEKKKLVIEKITGDFDVYISEEKIYSSNGFVSGDANGQKMYKKVLTREEMIAVLYRALHRNIVD